RRLSMRPFWRHGRAAPCRLYRELARPAAPRQPGDLHRREQSLAGGRLSEVIFRIPHPGGGGSLTARRISVAHRSQVWYGAAPAGSFLASIAMLPSMGVSDADREIAGIEEGA